MESTGGVGLFTILTVIFVIAKLLGFIAWPWLLVLLPAIISFTAKFLTVIFVIILAFLAD